MGYRGLFVVVGALVCGTVLLGPLARAQAPEGRTLDTLRLITFTPPLVLSVAQERGFFTAEGLVVEHTITSSSRELMTGVIDGTYDIAFTNPDNWITYAVRDGADVVMFQGVIGSTERTLVARPEIQSVADLRGQDIAVDAVDSGFVLILWQILADHGIDFRTGDPRLVPVGAPAQRLASMERGETVAAILVSPQTEEALARGYRVLGRSLDHLPQYPGPQGGTTRRWAAANEDRLVRFIRAYVAATDWALAPANREEAIALHQRRAGLERAVAEDDYAAVQPGATINIPGIQIVLDLRAALGFLPPPVPPAEQFYDTRYWERATGRPHP
ncbi:MAG: ABC transporter substrate-binding protein [Chloroflexi bacterium]|nr:ABC transporter substrate-binding protein [Chloroflexota bacterium]